MIKKLDNEMPMSHGILLIVMAFFTILMPNQALGLLCIGLVVMLVIAIGYAFVGNDKKTTAVVNTFASVGAGCIAGFFLLGVLQFIIALCS